MHICLRLVRLFAQTVFVDGDVSGKSPRTSTLVKRLYERFSYIAGLVSNACYIGLFYYLKTRARSTRRQTPPLSLELANHHLQRWTLPRKVGEGANPVNKFKRLLPM